MIKEVLGRDLHVGDFVLLDLSSNTARNKRYGLICGESQIFMDNKVVSYTNRSKVCYLIDSLNSDEHYIKSKLVKNFNDRLNTNYTELKDKLKNHTLSKGDVFIDEKDRLYIYLGECALSLEHAVLDKTYNEYLNALVSTGAHCFIKCDNWINYNYVTFQDTSLIDNFNVSNYQFKYLECKKLDTMSFSYLLFSEKLLPRFIGYVKNVNVTGIPLSGKLRRKDSGNNYEYAFTLRYK